MDNEISSDESKIYDRQIRIWGKENQMLLKYSTCLIIKITPISSELCRHLVLEGMSIHIIENNKNDLNDLTNNYLLKLSNINESKMESIIKSLKMMNPYCNITGSNDINDDNIYLKIQFIFIETNSIQLLSNIYLRAHKLGKKLFWCYYNDCFAYFVSMKFCLEISDFKEHIRTQIKIHNSKKEIPQHIYDSYFASILEVLGNEFSNPSESNPAIINNSLDETLVIHPLGSLLGALAAYYLTEDLISMNETSYVLSYRLIDQNIYKLLI